MTEIPFMQTLTDRQLDMILDLDFEQLRECGMLEEDIQEIKRISKIEKEFRDITNHKTGLQKMLYRAYRLIFRKSPKSLKKIIIAWEEGRKKHEYV